MMEIEIHNKAKQISRRGKIIFFKKNRPCWKSLGVAEIQQAITKVAKPDFILLTANKAIGMGSAGLRTKRLKERDELCESQILQQM